MADETNLELWRTALERIRDRFVGLANADAAEHFRHDVTLIRHEPGNDSIREWLIGAPARFGDNGHHDRKVIFATPMGSRRVKTSEPNLTDSIFSNTELEPTFQDSRWQRFTQVADAAAVTLTRMPRVDIAGLRRTSLNPCWHDWLTVLFSVARCYENSLDGPIFSPKVYRRCLASDGKKTAECTVELQPFFSFMDDVPNQSIALIDWLLSMPGESNTTPLPTAKVIEHPTGPVFLGLIVDESRGELRREGYNHEQPVTFDIDSTEWQTFLPAYLAGDRGATDTEWQRGYLGKWDQRRKTKKRCADKLAILKIGFEDGTLKLIDLTE